MWNENIIKNDFENCQKDKSNIIIKHNKSSINKKDNNSTLPFETSLGKDFVNLFAN